MVNTQVHKNLLSDIDINNITKDMLGTWFPWYFFKQSVPDETVNEHQQDHLFFQSSVFRHRFYDQYQTNSNWSGIVDTVVKSLSVKTGLKYKIKAAYSNLLPSNGLSKGLLDVPHVDRTEQTGKALTCVFYLTDSDEGTTIYQDREVNEFPDFNGVAAAKKMNIDQVVPAERNKLLVFDCRKYHSAPAACSKDRLVININIDVVD